MEVANATDLRIEELERQIAELRSENSKLLIQLASVPEQQKHHPEKLSDQAWRILDWLVARNPESLVEISFSLEISNQIGNACLTELASLGLVEKASRTSVVDKWQVTTKGREYLSQAIGIRA